LLIRVLAASVDVYIKTTSFISLVDGKVDRGQSVVTTPRYRQLRSCISIPGRELSLLQSVQPPAPIQWVTGALALEVERPGREIDHSNLSVRLRMDGAVGKYSWRGA
jgi:hypothetical protein